MGPRFRMIVASRAGGNGIPDRPARSIKSGIAIRRAGRPTGDRTAGNHSANHDQGLHDGHRFRPEPGTEGASSRGAARTGVMRAAFDVAVDFARRLLGIDSDTVLSPRSGRLRDALCFPPYGGGNMGKRRRQLHRKLMSPEHEPMASAEGR